MPWVRPFFMYVLCGLCGLYGLCGVCELCGLYGLYVLCDLRAGCVYLKVVKYHLRACSHSI